MAITEFLALNPSEDEPPIIRHLNTDYSKPDGWPRLLRASGNASGGCVVLTVERYPVIRYTACGVWVSEYGRERFVNLRAGKQWASTTQDEAVAQLYHRKRAQVRILSGLLADAEAVQASMEKHLGFKAPPRRPYYGGYDYY